MFNFYTFMAQTFCFYLLLKQKVVTILLFSNISPNKDIEQTNKDMKCSDKLSRQGMFLECVSYFFQNLNLNLNCITYTRYSVRI